MHSVKTDMQTYGGEIKACSLSTMSAIQQALQSIFQGVKGLTQGPNRNVILLPSTGFEPVPFPSQAWRPTLLSQIPIFT